MPRPWGYLQRNAATAAVCCVPFERRTEMGEQTNAKQTYGEELVTGARYVYVRQPIEITDGMVDRASAAGAAWFREHPDGASSDGEWRDFYRTVLTAAELRD